MIRAFAAKWTKRLIDAATCFLREPLRAVAAAGLVFGFVFVAMVVTLVVSMFVPTMPLAATVVVPLAWLAGAILGLIAIIVLAQLGFDKLTFTLPNGSSFTAEDARDRAVERLEKVAEALTPDDPS